MRAEDLDSVAYFRFIQRLSWPGSDYSTARLLRAIRRLAIPYPGIFLRVCTGTTWPFIRQRVCARLIFHGTSWTDMPVLTSGETTRHSNSRFATTYSECNL